MKWLHAKYFLHCTNHVHHVGTVYEDCEWLVTYLLNIHEYICNPSNLKHKSSLMKNHKNPIPKINSKHDQDHRLINFNLRQSVSLCSKGEGQTSQYGTVLHKAKDVTRHFIETFLLWYIYRILSCNTFHPTCYLQKSQVRSISF